VTRVKYHPPDKEERMERGRKIDLLLDETMRRERERKEAEKRRQQKDEEEERIRRYFRCNYNFHLITYLPRSITQHWF